MRPGVPPRSVLIAVVMSLVAVVGAPAAAQETTDDPAGADAGTDAATGTDPGDDATPDGGGGDDPVAPEAENPSGDETGVTDDEAGTPGEDTGAPGEDTGAPGDDTAGADDGLPIDGTGPAPGDDPTEDGTEATLPPCPPAPDEDGVVDGDGDTPPATVPPADDGAPTDPTADPDAPLGCTNLPDDLPQPEGDDELSGEGPSERPDGDEAEGWVQQPFEPTTVIQELVDAAQAKVDEALDERVDSIARARVLKRRLKELEADREALDTADRDAAVRLADVTERLQLRATMAFVVGDNSRLAVATSNEEALQADAQQHVVDQVVEDELALISDYRDLRAQLSEEALDVVARLGVVEDLLGSALEDVEAIDLRIQDLELEVLAFSNGAQSFISGIRFPIGGPYGVPLIDSWGFPRMMGTPDEHWHEGIDIFAPLGTPLVATESGTITNIGVGRLGGLKFWLTGDSGTKWYYAHLSDFAEGLVVGQRVLPGDVLGYVGNTGNAVGTPYHLHLQMHPDGGEPANPYPILKAASDWERSVRISAGLPEFIEP